MNTSRPRKPLLLATLLSLACCGLQAQDSSAPSISVSSSSSSASDGSNAAQPSKSSTPDCITSVTKNCDLDTTIKNIAPPDSPAFTVLGLSPSNASRPTSPSTIATAALNAFDDNGHFQSGTAIDFVPFLVFAHNSFSLGQYTSVKDDTRKRKVASYLVRLATRSSISYATTKGVSESDGAVRMATGVRVGIIDEGDPRAAFRKCAADVDVPLDPDSPNGDGASSSQVAVESTDTDTKIAQLKAKIDDLTKAVGDLNAKQKNPDAASGTTLAIRKCRTDAAKKVWNSTSLVIAGAPAWISTDGSTNNLKLNGGGAWISLAKGFGSIMQIIASARRETGQSVVPAATGSSSTSNSTTSTQYVLQDTTVAGGSVRFGKGDFNSVVSGLYIGKRTNGVADSYPEFGFGIEKKLSANFYLDVSYRYDVTSKSVSGLLTNLKWSFNRQPELKHGS